MRRVITPRGAVTPRGRVVDRGMTLEDEVVVDDTVGQTSVVRAPWSPAQIVALSIGAMLTLLGAVALARTGINFNDVTAQHVNVAGFHHTALLGLLEFAVGLFLIGVGAVPGAARMSMTFFGIVLLGMGIVVAASPLSFHAGLGTHSGHGFLYMISGATLLITAMVAPIFFDRDARRYTRTSDVVERHRY
jgi:hypothetical protein